MPKVSQSHFDNRRRQIIDAAIVCFSRDGFHRTTMQDIVSQSALSPGAIYSYFASKDDIIKAIATERHQRERQAIARASAHPNTGMTMRLLIRDFFGVLVSPEEQEQRRLGVQLWAEALRNPQIMDVVREGVDEPLHLFTDLITVSQQRGELPADILPEALARVMIALFQGFVLQQAWDENADVDSYITTIESLFKTMLPSARDTVS